MRVRIITSSSRWPSCSRHRSAAKQVNIHACILGQIVFECESRYGSSRFAAFKSRTRILRARIKGPNIPFHVNVHPTQWWHIHIHTHIHGLTDSVGRSHTCCRFTAKSVYARKRCRRHCGVGCRPCFVCTTLTAALSLSLSLPALWSMGLWSLLLILHFHF